MGNEQQVTIPMETLNASIEAIRTGWEYAREALAEHDVKLGRTTRRNRIQAEVIEADIDRLFRAKGILQIYSDNKTTPE